LYVSSIHVWQVVLTSRHLIHLWYVWGPCLPNYIISIPKKSSGINHHSLLYLFHFDYLFVYSRTSNCSAIWRAVTITGDRAAKLDLCLALTAFSSKDSFATPTATWDSEGQGPMSHSGIRTRNVRIIRYLRHCSNQCAMRASRISFQTLQHFSLPHFNPFKDIHTSFWNQKH
jgi:hypothetical protein